VIGDDARMGAKKKKAPKAKAKAKPKKAAAGWVQVEVPRSAKRSFHRPPLPPLEGQDLWWIGSTKLASWAGFRFHSEWLNERPKPRDGTVEIRITSNDDAAADPSDAPIAAYRYVVENEAELTKRVLARILAEYPALKKAYDEAIDETWPQIPEVTDAEGLKAVLGPPMIHLPDIPATKRGPVIGFAWSSCAWDEEHGFGVMMNGLEVEETGEQSVAI
jgi:hypothetical protein